eukprot:7641690-Ditylum_brightwellii.AAC.1
MNPRNCCNPIVDKWNCFVVRKIRRRGGGNLIGFRATWCSVKHWQIVVFVIWGCLGVKVPC